MKLVLRQVSKININASIMQTKKLNHALFEQEGQKPQQFLQTPSPTRPVIHHKIIFHLARVKKEATNKKIHQILPTNCCYGQSTKKNDENNTIGTVDEINR
jgi:hypothetical protein